MASISGLGSSIGNWVNQSASKVSGAIKKGFGKLRFNSISTHDAKSQLKSAKDLSSTAKRTALVQRKINHATTGTKLASSRKSDTNRQQRHTSPEQSIARLGLARQALSVQIDDQNIRVLEAADQKEKYSTQFKNAIKSSGASRDEALTSPTFSLHRNRLSRASKNHKDAVNIQTNLTRQLRAIDIRIEQLSSREDQQLEQELNKLLKNG